MKIKKILLLSIGVSSILFAGKNVTLPESEPISVPTQEVKTETAKDFKYLIAAKVGTLGIGVEGSYKFNRYLALRANINGAKFNLNNVKINSTTYNINTNLFTAGLLLDLYLFNGDLRVSAGGYYNNNKLTLKTSEWKYNNIPYTNPITLNMKFKKFSPYVGIGRGGRIGKTGWDYSVDLGVMYHGKPTLTVNSSDPNAIGFKNKLENDLKSAKFYPVFSIGVAYSF